MSEKLGKLAQEMEHMKLQGPKKFDVSELMLSSAVALPPNFKVPDYDKYDGTGCPRSHMRWKRKAAQLSRRLSEEEQIKLVMKSLSTQYFHFMAQQHYPNFNHLIQTGTKTEDAIAKDLRARPSSSDIREGKRPMVIQKEVNNVNQVRPVAKTFSEIWKPEEKKAPRHFDLLPYPLPVILKKLIRDRKIKLPDIRPIPDPLPKYWRLDQYCEYHRNSGHLTERCLALKHAIQNMIEKGDLAVGQPNTTQNPFPNHHAISPPATNAIFVDEPLLDPLILICAITSDKPYVLRLDDEKIRELKKEKPYFLSVNDGDFVESSSRPYAFRCEDIAKEKKIPYILRIDEYEKEQMNKTPYVLKIEDDDLFLADQCDELRHVIRGGRVFKLPELSAENPAEVLRAAENQRQNRPVTEEEIRHRKLVLRELNVAQVSVDTIPDELVSLVAMARASRTLSFTDEDLPPEGRDHTKSLKITVICNKKKKFVPSEQGILAYDGTRRDVIGTLVTEIQIGGEEFEIEFQVIDIKASFLLLLGRLWLHRVGVVPLHHKLKFIRNNRVVTVKGDLDLEIGLISQELIIDKAGDIRLIGFSLEVTAITMEEAMNEEIFFLSSTNSNVVKMIR
ncbi:uncharacterized protein LOC143880678 [Tasmannia lanceolata]|uniref:uncharacterized protein LOC143880678 n=1 Tax=Tasmannia lanceolata TaxID=3420 RepID=UPI004063AFC7